MRRTRLLGVALALLMLAPALGAQPGPGSPQVVDPPDDAREADTRSMASLATSTACRAGGPSSYPLCGAAPAGPAAGGEPAPPTMEAISATFRDTPSDLVVELELAQVSADFEGASGPSDLGPDAKQGALYSVCWSTSGEACDEAVVLAAIPAPDGAPAVTALYEVSSVSCNDAARCAWRVPYELVPGSPGRLRWVVPRSVMPNATEATVLFAPELSVTRYLSPHGRPAWPSEDGVGYGVIGPDANTSTFGYTANHYVPVDTSAPGEDYAFTTPLAPVRIEGGVGELADPPGDVVGEARDDIDVLGLRISETDSTFTIAVQVASVEAEPAEHHLYGAFALPTGRFYTWGYSAIDGLRQSYANVCAVPRCQAMAEPSIRHLPINLSVTAGAPGWVSATFSRDALGSPARGDLLNSVDVTMFTYNETATREQALPGGRVVVLASGGTDTLAPALPWWFLQDTRPGFVSEGLSVEDELGDVQGLLRANARVDQFDLTYLEAVGASPMEVRVTLSLRDLSKVEVPTGANAIFYGVGIERSDGRRFMLGFHRAAGTPTQPGDQTFLCAEDAIVLAPSKADPTSVPYTEIAGSVSGRGGPSLASASQEGAIMLFVPYTCFGETQAVPLDIKTLRGGSYVVRPDGIIEADTVAHPTGGVIASARVAAPCGPWYAEPFCVSNFWDIFGIGITVVASAVGVFALRRKRAKLKRQLAEVERVIIVHENDAPKREQALLAIRHKLKEDVINHRIDHTHYSLVDRRIDEVLAKTRVLAISEAFDELPHRLLRRLQDLLVDGQMSKDDYRVFSALIEETDLTPDAKARIRRKLGNWVREDAAQEPDRKADA